MSGMTPLIERYGLSVRTSTRLSLDHRCITTYTLSYARRSLQGEAFGEETLTCEQALALEFAMAYGAQYPLPEEQASIKKARRRLQAFLKEHHDEFLQAYRTDREASSTRRPSLEVRPDPNPLPGRSIQKFTKISYRELAFGQRIVYFEAITKPNALLLVGRVERVMLALPEELVLTGLAATVELLQADFHESLATHVYQKYLYPTFPEPGIYSWPRDLPAQTFKRTKFQEDQITFQIKLPMLPGIIIEYGGSPE